jgi:uncharacterized protein with FMN-binding domain
VAFPPVTFTASTSHSDKEDTVRRTALTIVATVVGLVLLLQFKTHSSGASGSSLASLGPLSSRSQGATRPSPAATRTPQRSSRHSQPPRHRQTSSAKPTVSATITATGQTVQTRYGPVQVRIVETAGRLTDVTAIQLPSADSHSSDIAAAAAPILRSEALRANSARIDTVSGATYTSDGYAQSLQSALDNA